MLNNLIFSLILYYKMKLEIIFCVPVLNCKYDYLQAILDHDNYIMNLTEANLDNKPIWQFEYSAKVGCVWVLLGFCNVKACCIDSGKV